MADVRSDKESVGQPIPGGLRAALWLGVAVFFLWPVIQHAHQVGAWHDWTYFSLHAEATRQTLSIWHQLPQWNPWYCGGIPGIGNVQSDAGSPFQLFNMLFGAMPGMRVTWVVFVALGMEGGYRYARELGSGNAGAVAAAITYACCGRVTQLFIDGHLAFIGFLMLPWLVWCFERSLRDMRFAIGGGLCMSLVFMQGGAIPTPLIAVFLAFYLVAVTIREAAWPVDWARARRPLMALGAMALVTVGTAAVRLLPFVETLLKYPRETHMIESFSDGQILSMLGARVVDGGYNGPGTAYVGMFVLVLALLGVASRRRHAVMLLVLFGAVWNLTSGYGDGPRLYELLRELPVLENVRNPFRYSFILAFLAAQLAGMGISSIAERAGRLRSSDGEERVTGRRARCAVGTALCVAVVASVVPFQQRRMAERVQFRPPVASAEGDTFRQAIGNRWHSHVWPRIQRGTLSCFEEQPFEQSALLRADLPDEEYFDARVDGTVERLSWSPHRILLAVELTEPATLFVNQNHHRGWRASEGEVFSHEGLLAVRLPAGEYELALRFRDNLIMAGLAISLASWLAILLVLRATNTRGTMSSCRSTNRPE